MYKRTHTVQNGIFVSVFLLRIIGLKKKKSKTD